MLTKWSIVFFIWPTICLGDLGVEVIRPGIGRFGELNFTEVVELQDGYRIQHHVEPNGTYGPTFRMKWSSGVWSVLDVKKESTGRQWIEFQPFGNENGLGGHDLSPVVLPPLQQFSEYGLDYVLPDRGACIPNCDAYEAYVEFSLVEIAPPLLGDFNLDNKVGFADFISLSRNFGESLGGGNGLVFLSWTDGDANLNGVIDFDDFNLLSQNFGATRDTPNVASSPEPSTGGMLVLTIAGWMCRRSPRRRRA